MKRLHPIVAAIIATFAAIIALEFTATEANGGSRFALPIIWALAGVHAWFLGRGRASADDPSARKPVTRVWAIVIGAAIFVLIFQVLVRQVVAVAAWPVSPRGSAHLGVLIQTAERTLASHSVYSEPIAMDGYTERPSAMPGLLAPFLAARANSFDWRFTTLAAESLFGALAIGLVALAWRARVPTSTVLAAALGLSGAFLLPSLANYIQWGIAAPIWAAIALFCFSLAAGIPLLAGIAAGALASMSVGWLLLFPVAATLLWRLHKESAIPGIILGAIFPATALLSFSGEFALFLQGILGVPFLNSDPVQAGDLQPWLHPSLLGGVVPLKLAVPLMAWAVLWVARTTWLMPREQSAARALERFALAAFVVLACGPATTMHDWIAHLVLLGGILAAQSTLPARQESPTRAFAIPGVFAFGVAATMFFAPILWRLAKPNWGALDIREGNFQPHGEGLMIGWLAPEADVTWAHSPNAEVAFYMRRARPSTLEVTLETPAGEFAPYNPIRVLLNGRKVAEWIALPGEQLPCRIDVADASTFVAGANVLTFEAEWSRTPKALGTGPGTQARAFAYRGLKLVPKSKENSE